ncbi:MAG: hypothetical protein SOR89_00780 [Ndongobacter sp.]|nr:hypothetical protein [Ndongobacter sp.]
MSGLFAIIAKYRSQLTMLPTMIIIFVTATILCYIAFNRYRWVKYLPALFGICLGIFNVFAGWRVFTTAEGLDIMWKAIYFFVAGCIALGTAWIIAMLSAGELNGKKKEPRKPAAKKERQS